MNRKRDIGACALRRDKVCLMECTPSGDARWVMVLTPAEARQLADELLRGADVAQATHEEINGEGDSQ